VFFYNNDMLITVLEDFALLMKSRFRMNDLAEPENIQNSGLIVLQSSEDSC
jgi:hypothetical protein